MAKIYDDYSRQSRIAVGMFGEGEYSVCSFLTGWRVRMVGIFLAILSLLLIAGCGGGDRGSVGDSSIETQIVGKLGMASQESDGVAGCDMDTDCDGVLDIHEVGSCKDKPDCDNDTVKDSDEVMGCVLKSDCDADNKTDDVDIDDDGDGLIEIHTAEELDAVRYQLRGIGLKRAAVARLDQTGCGNGVRVRVCSGYELVGDISLSDYISTEYGEEGWQPIAPDINTMNSVCDGARFAGAFEGNGFVIRGLFINRTGEDCIGLFGQTNGRILNLGVVADKIMGRDYVGVLVGQGSRASIIQSYGVSGLVSGNNRVGGLVGEGSRAGIVRSYGVSGEVRGEDAVGGLVGHGWGAGIAQSYGVSSVVSGDAMAGGLMGFGTSAEIVQSYGVSGSVSGNNRVGGLVGHGVSTKIVQSYGVSNQVSGYDRIGGLVGHGWSAEIVQSYSVSGLVNGSSRVGGLVGLGGSAETSYWDSETSGGVNDASGGSQAQTSMALRSPTGYGGIYGSWDDGAIRGDTMLAGIDHNGTIWCDEDLSGVIEFAEMRNHSHAIGDNRVWDFGRNNDYPVIRCAVGGLFNQRIWWSLDDVHKPQLNQTHLAQWLKGLLPLPSHGKGDSKEDGEYTIGGDGDSGGVATIPSHALWSVIPITGGFSIHWHNLGNFSRANGPQRLSITLLQEGYLFINKTTRTASIVEFVDGIYNLTGLMDGQSYRFASEISLAYGDIPYSRPIEWLWEVNKLDNDGSGIVVGMNYDGDGQADSIDMDDDNDGVNDRRNGTVLDRCPQGVLNWVSNGTNDVNGDGCRDSDEDLDGDNDGVLNENEVVGCELTSDCDNDNVTDDVDIDNDGDGLIEIGTAAELDAVRYVLDGSGFKRTENGTIDYTGCPADGCEGYELVGDISLTNYIVENYPVSGWQPIAPDMNTANTGCDGDKFTGIFDGNGFEVRGLFINRPNENCIGLFGRANGVVRHLGVVADSIIGRKGVGGLVGYSDFAEITRSYAVSNEVNGHDRIGGLVGYDRYGSIIESYVVIRKVSGNNYVGGLVGIGSRSKIVQSYVVNGEVRGYARVGGLVGRGSSTEIVQSYAVSDEVKGRYYVGGLVGRGYSAEIIQSYVVSGEVSGNDYVGGLVGYGKNAEITQSYAVSGEVSGNREIGSLVGNGEGAEIIQSYVVSGEVRGMNNDIGGLVGNGEGAEIIQSYVVSGEVIGNHHVGGLVGNGEGAEIIQSYVVSGEVIGNHHVGGLVGYKASTRDSYWDTQTSGRTNDGATNNSGLTSMVLRSPTDYDRIYNNWDEGAISEGNTIAGVNRNGTIWCDGDIDGVIEDNEMRDSNRIWDFGTSIDYPAIRCTSDGLVNQRNWWYLNSTTHKPQLNQVLLEIWLGDCILSLNCDNDSLINSEDTCPVGQRNWRSNATNDYDGDGCRNDEDPDNDNDRVLNTDEAAGCELNSDCDNDSLIDSEDTCPTGQRDWKSSAINDYDGDGCRNDEDPDGDNDGVLNTDEVPGCELNLDCDNDMVLDVDEEIGCVLKPDCDNDEVLDSNEELGCVLKLDCDNDSYSDAVDIFPTDSFEWLDTDGDRVGDNGDNCPLVANSDQLDTDRDGEGDVCDIDRDNDGFLNEEDAFPLDSSEWLDTDSDGIGDNGDNCPSVANSDQLDTDGDSKGDVCDMDQDNDGFPNEEDAFPLDSSEWLDSDGDGVANGDEVIGCELFTDCDNDTYTDIVDIDDDGDGLIEIGMAEELDAVRYVLDGSGFKRTENTIIDYTGCPTDRCRGYELVHNISLTSYIVENYSVSGWQPIAHDADLINYGCDGDKFTGVFDGNGFVASGLFIQRPDESCVGLFGQVNGTIRHLGVVADRIIGRNTVGGLVGDGDRAEIIQSYAMSDEVRGGYGVGGLVGRGSSIDIVHSYAVNDEVRGGYGVGGLVGRGSSIDIVRSYAVNDEVRGDGEVGGLVGRGNSIDIVHSYAVSDEVRGDGGVGGLVGHGGSTDIVHSYAVSDTVRGRHDVGGLVGYGRSANIVHSYAVNDEVRGDGEVGGLVGRGSSTDIVHSYAVSDEVRGVYRVGGLVGRGEHTSIVHSHAVSDEVKGRYDVGGLVGRGKYINITQSYTVSNMVNGSQVVGGLVGTSESAEIIQSYTVSGTVSGSGLVGDSTSTKVIQSYAVNSIVSGSSLVGGDGSTDIIHSYVVSGTGGNLAGQGDIRASYWDSNTSGRSRNGFRGSARKTSMALYSPTDYDGIYSTWDDGLIVDGIDNNGTIWCDEDQSGMIEADERRDDNHINGDNRVWDFGTDTDYPAIRCTGDSLVDQRSWWYLNSTTHKPQINQVLLGGWLDGLMPLDVDGPGSCILSLNCDNDSLIDIEDACPFGQRNWRSDATNDYDADGCHNDEDLDSDNDGVLNIDEVAGCELNSDCDNDTVSDGDEEVSCVLNPDCDNDEVLDSNEEPGCVLKLDCDNDSLTDSEDVCPVGRMNWHNNGTNDYDRDGCHNDEDLDNDNDEVLNINEVAGCELKSDCDSDTVLDGAEEPGCELLTDCDNDSYNDAVDIFPTDSSEWLDTDSDRAGDNGDNCRLVANSDQLDTDGDGMGDVCDEDKDGDGVANGNEVAGCELLADCDNDNYNDAVDAFPTDDSEWLDSDRDGIGDNSDNCPLVANNDQLDTDGDGTGDMCDGDKDGDGVANGDEEAGCELLADCDNDTYDDVVDAFPIDGSEWLDSDRDGIGDNSDNCPLVANNDQLDTDGDGTGDVCDGDKDGDGMANEDELIGCELLADCDNDQIVDGVDACPAGQRNWHSNGSNDVDRDGCHNDEDIDNDGDGLIEIGMAKELDAVRYVLDGSGFKRAENASIDYTGCPIDGCEGYELVRDISLTDYIAENYSVLGWQPIASDDGTRRNDVCGGDKFTGIFDGNSFEVRGLFINRPDEDCIGLFGQVAGTIRHLEVVVNRVIGRHYVGGLVGSSRGAELFQSYTVSNEVGGGDKVGGLVGYGWSTDIIQSYAASNLVSGSSEVGGLVGSSDNVVITQSYAVSGQVRGSGRYVGGLVGIHSDIKIIQSYAVSDAVRGDSSVGGLVGLSGRHTDIIQSYAVSGMVSGSRRVGGLVGSGQGTSTVHSYAVSGEVRGNNDWVGRLWGVGGLWGLGGYSRGSYWDINTSGTTHDGGRGSHGQTSMALYSPIDYDTIYSSWNDGAIDERSMVGGIDHNGTIWCDLDLSSMIEANEKRDDNRVWDFGTDTDYPALRCIGDTLVGQRAWWYLNSTTHKPQINQTHLDERIDTDSDRISDNRDNCPLVANRDQLDTDRDGIGNVCDGDKDGDGVANRDEVVGCELLADCDNDSYSDAVDDFPMDSSKWLDRDGDKDDDGVANGDELTGCELLADCDNDNHVDAVDIDDDGDGLIEIGMAEELDAVRYVLDGSGFKRTENATIDYTGCPTDGCEGYELVHDISLTDYIAERYLATGWLPIAPDVDTINTGCDGDKFTGTFDGNGFVVSGLLISRSGEDCIGLFGRVDGMIRHLGVVADGVVGRNHVGGLVGSGRDAEIVQSYAVSSVVSGSGRVGGLVGYGWFAEIVQSYAVSSVVNGDDRVGGLIGHGRGTDIVQSYAVSSEVNGGREVGGLVGSGLGAEIVQSYAVSGAVRGDGSIGGLVGIGGRVSESYWDTQTIGVTSSGVGGTQGQNSMVLRSPINYDGVYSNWADGAIGEGNAVAGVNRNGTIWCDEDQSGTIEAGERRDDSHINEDNRIWDFGTDIDYPAIRCTGDSLVDQRSWWYLNSTTYKPHLNQVFLEAWLEGLFSLDRDGPKGCILSLNCDNDSLIDIEDTCPFGQRNWRSDATNDYDGDGCRNDEDSDHDNDGALNVDEVAGCELNSDCDNDGVLDGDELAGCELLADCDNDQIADSVDTCPAGQKNWHNNGSNDVDRDGCHNDEDIDTDGDGLIEIGTAEELDAVRYVLDGSGFKRTENTIINYTGCPTDGCEGYELVRDISLTDYITERYSAVGWLPIAPGMGIANIDCDGDKFTGIFDGNGFVVSGLFINRSGENCVGLFGQMNGVIRHLGVVADRIIGTNRVGALVGYGRGAEIFHSYAVSGMINGESSVGGLVGYGDSADIVQSYAVSDAVRGKREVGGLVGYGGSADIVHSYAVSSEVWGRGWYVGGLIGSGRGVDIVQSYVVSGEVRGNYPYVGGLVGEGGTARTSYWDTETSGRTNDRATGSNGQTSMALRLPTDYNDLYSTWDDGLMVDSIDDNGTIWCDEDYSGMIEADERWGGNHTHRDNRIWNFGTDTDYPAIRCTDDSLVDQRSWWYLNSTTHKPQLNQFILRAWLDGSLPFDGDGPKGCIVSLNCDNDSLIDIEDTCPVGQRNWRSDATNDYDGDGCHNDEDLDSDNDGVLNIDEVAGCELNSDCDNDKVLDGAEESSCILNPDCDNDEVLDGNEEVGCVLKLDCDNDSYNDAVDIFPVDSSEWLDTDRDRVGDNSDNCPLVANSDQLDMDRDSMGDICDRDRDGDNITDDMDIDDDGDGLIEIRTARELDAVRYILNGRGFKRTENATIDYTGCPANRCKGYELMRDISLTDYIAENYPVLGWRPIASDGRPGYRFCQGNKFKGIFDGNGFVVSGLFIDRLGEDCIGLFGQVTGTIRHLGVVADKIIGRDYVGVLVGEGGRTAIISHSYVVSNVVRGNWYVGGLVGWGNFVKIIQSYAVSDTVDGTGSVGGLVGHGWGTKIVQSYAVSEEVRGHDRIGGLVGYGSSADIVQSYAVSGRKTNIALRLPTSYDGIYSTWDDGLIVDGMDSNGTIWCDEDYSAVIEADEKRDDSHINGDNRVWDFGTDIDYPAIRCTGDSLVDQRSWWYLNSTTRKPQLNQFVLRAWLDGSLPFDGDGAKGCIVSLNCDNDSLMDIEDACPLGQRNWRSDTTNDYDGDGCHNDEDPDGDNDGVLNTDEMVGCELNSDCDNDRVMDGDEEVGCVLNLDCDNDGYDDAVDIFPTDSSEWLDTDRDGIGDNGDNCLLVANSNQLDTDGDGTGDVCDRDKDGDGVANRDELTGCELLADCDNDSHVDALDIDADGDGLIEIGMAEELDAVRYVLDGSGFKRTENATINYTGCPTDGCEGYELVRDISLTDYIAERYSATGWLPIAPDVDTTNTYCDGDKFTGIFNGNNFVVRGLFINRSGEDCIGLFGQVDGTIRSLGVAVDSIMGRNYVGSLVGDSRGTEILQSYTLSGLVSGGDWVGGLVGSGRDAAIVQSYAVSSEVRGSGWYVGGLVGSGRDAAIVQSYAVSGIVIGRREVGGLVGWGTDATIVQSYAVSSEVQGSGWYVGGLMGSSGGAEIVQSYVVSGKVQGISQYVGGLVGRGDSWYGYVDPRALSSYWDIDTSGRINDHATGSSGQTSMALRSPTSYDGVYSTWDDGLMVDSMDDNGTIWCDEDQSGMIEDNEIRNASYTNGDNRVWDFGTDTDYPAIRCTGDSLVDQRAWWYLNSTTNKPNLNRTRLDAWLDGSLFP